MPRDVASYLWIALLMTIASAEDGVLSADSVHRMQVLYRSEKSFVSQIIHLADRIESAIKSLRMYAESFNNVKPMKGGSEAMQNPINAHLLVRHLALGWPAVDRALRSLLTTMETIKYLQGRKQREVVPSVKDLEVTELALGRLVGAYQLNATELAKNGAISSKDLGDIQSGKTLSVWELGRIALGLLNQQHFAQAIELLDASVEILKGQTFQDNTSPSSSALVVPFFIRENVENGDLLSIKYKAMQQHDSMLQKVLQGEAETCGEGLRALAFIRPSMRLNGSTLVRTSSCQLQLNQEPSPMMEREQTVRLCRGQELRDLRTLAKLRCRFSSLTFPPTKLEEVSLEPYIILAHELMTSAQMQFVIRQSVGKIKSNPGGPSMSFKSFKLQEIGDHLLPFISRLEQITGTPRRPRDDDHQLEFLVKNYGVAGTFGLHRDNRHATALVYLTPVDAGGYTVFPRLGIFVRPRPGSALIFRNVVDSVTNEPDHLTVHSDCPVVLGNKWVLHHWINDPSQTTSTCSKAK